jgi:hypothetical protein
MVVRRIILVLSAIAVVLLGLERVGVYRFVPEGDVHFEVEAPQNPNRLLLRNDAGALKGWVRLVVIAPNGNPLSISPHNWPGDPLGVDVRSLGSDQFEIVISKKPNPPAGVPFDWPSGVPIELGIDSKLGGPIAVTDWTVYNNRQESDTLAKVQRRWWWTRISLGLLVLALMGAALTALAEKDERQAADPVRVLIRTIVISIEGKTPAETKKIRRFLSQVLLMGTPISEAVERAGYDIHEKLRWGPFVARSKTLFTNRANAVRTALDNAANSLSL